MTLLRFWVIRYGVIAASYGGKAKTLAQIIAIGLYLLPLPAGSTRCRVGGHGHRARADVVTGVDYVVRAIRLRARVARNPLADALGVDADSLADARRALRDARARPWRPPSR